MRWPLKRRSKTMSLTMVVIVLCSCLTRPPSIHTAIATCDFEESMSTTASIMHLVKLLASTDFGDIMLNSFVRPSASLARQHKHDCAFWMAKPVFANVLIAYSSLMGFSAKSASCYLRYFMISGFSVRSRSRSPVCKVMWPKYPACQICSLVQAPLVEAMKSKFTSTAFCLSGFSVLG